MVETTHPGRRAGGRHRISFARMARAIVSPVLAVAALLVALLALPLSENNLLSIPFGATVIVGLSLLTFLWSRRIAFSIYSALAIVAIVTIVSALKYKLKGFSLHFYDAVAMAGDAEMYRFLLSSYLHVVGPVLVAAFAAIGLLALLYRLDRPRALPLRVRAMLVAAPAVLLPLTLPNEAVANQRYFYYLLGRHTTAFFVSLLDVGNLFGRSDLEARLAQMPPEPAFSGAADCGSGDRPDVFLVLAESQTDPTIFPQIASAETIAAGMEAAAGPLQPLQVETFGGGTWISNLSLMTGLSATDFGWRSPYLTISLENGVKASLPEIFARCGYRTAAILPLDYSFVNEGPFLSSIGFETVLDKDDIGASHYHLRDSFYLDAAAAFAARHRAEDGRPLFLLIQTMFAHSPYNERMEPDLQPQAAALDADPEVDEYLRRMAIANNDLGAFMRATVGGEERRSVMVTFGDHQAFVTKPFVEALAGENALADPTSLAYRTFYAIAGAEPAAADAAPIDIAFLGNRVLEAAGLGGNDLFRDLARLERLCGGRFHLCPHRSEIDRHLKRRVDSGMLRLDGG